MNEQFIVSDAPEEDIERACSIIEDLVYKTHGGAFVTAQQKLCFPNERVVHKSKKSTRSVVVPSSNPKRFQTRKKKGKKKKKSRANFSDSTSSDGSEVRAMHASFGVGVRCVTAYNKEGRKLAGESPPHPPLRFDETSSDNIVFIYFL